MFTFWNTYTAYFYWVYDIRSEVNEIKFRMITILTAALFCIAKVYNSKERINARDTRASCDFAIL